MISVENACKIIISKIIPMKSEIIHVSKSLGRVLSKDVKSKLNSPPENISAMDGYAICAKNISNIPVKLKNDKIAWKWSYTISDDGKNFDIGKIKYHDIHYDIDKSISKSPKFFLC